MTAAHKFLWKFSESLDNKSWFQPSLSRERAEKNIQGKPVGSFVVRGSSRKNCFAVTYKTPENKIEHALIQKGIMGYSLPDDKKGRIFPTLEALLRQTKFINFHSVESNSELAKLKSAFPNVSEGVIQDALNRAGNDPNLAIDVLLRAESGESAYMDFRSSRRISSRLVPFASESISEAFTYLSNFNTEAEDSFEKWMRVTRPLSDPSPQVAKIESKIYKMLQNTENEVGGKVSIFKLTFNAQYSEPELDQINSIAASAIADVQNFIRSLQTGITFGGHDGALIFWKTLETVLFEGIFDTVFETICRKYQSLNETFERKIETMDDITLFELGAAPRFELSEDPHPYAKAITAISKLPFLRSVNDKLTCLIATFQAIHECVEIHYKKYNPTTDASLEVTSIDLVPIFTYVLCKSKIPNIHSEFLFLREFTPAPLKAGQDGFALATLQTCLNHIERVKLPSQKGSKKKERLSYNGEGNLGEEFQFLLADLRLDADFQEMMDELEGIKPEEDEETSTSQVDEDPAKGEEKDSSENGDLTPSGIDGETSNSDLSKRLPGIYIPPKPTEPAPKRPPTIQKPRRKLQKFREESPGLSSEFSMIDQWLKEAIDESK